MSSESRPEVRGSAAQEPLGDGRRVRQAERRFRRTLAATLGILIVAVGGLTAANAVHGPRILDGEINSSAAIERAQQRLVLQVDQPVVDVAPEDVVVEPATGFELETEGSTLTLRFDSALRYATEYRVEVTGAQGTATGARGDMTWSFETPDAEVHALQRAGEPGAPDRIVRRTLGGAEPEVVVEAPRIQEYAIVGQSIAVVSLDDDNVASLLLVAADGSGTSQVALPGEGSVTELHASGTTGLLGFVFTSRPDAAVQVPRVLSVYDTTDPSGVTRPVVGLDGEPLSVLDWLFVPGTTSIVAQDDEEALFLIDPLGDSAPSPLGAHSEMRGFIAGTTRLVVADPQQGSVIDLGTGETSVLDLPESDLPEGAGAGPLIALTSDSYLELVSTFDDATTGSGFSSRILRVDESGTEQLWAPAAEGTRVGSICLSPNGQFVAAETISAEGIPDGYPDVPGSTATSTVFIDIATGESSRGIAGFLVDWCG